MAMSRGTLLEMQLNGSLKSYILVGYDEQGLKVAATRYGNQLEFDALRKALEDVSEELENAAIEASLGLDDNEGQDGEDEAK